MSQQVNVYEAKTNLSRLLDQVAGGAEVVIARSGRPVARLVPFESRATPRKPGAWRRRVVIARDFDGLPDDLAAAFRGEHR